MMNTERWQLTLGMEATGLFDFVDVHTFSKRPVDLFELWREHDEPDVLLLEDYDWAWKLHLPTNYLGARKVPVPIWAFIADYWYSRSYKRLYYESNGITGLVVLHEAALEYILKFFSCPVQRVTVIPFTVDPADFPVRTVEKDVDVFCSGFMGPELYPCRERIDRALRSEPQLEVDALSHPGYWKQGERRGVFGTAYYSRMSHAKYVLSTTGRFNISPRKHIEAIGARCKILGDVTGFEEHRGFERFLEPVDLSMSDSEIARKVVEACADWEWSKEDEGARQQLLDFHGPITVARRLAIELLSGGEALTARSRPAR